MKNKQGKRRWWLYILIILIIVGMVDEIWSGIENNLIQKTITEWQDKATLAMAEPPNSYTEARAWLAANGFKVLFWNPNIPNGWLGRQTGTGGTWNIIKGQQSIPEKSWLLQITFQFNPDTEQFHRVIAERAYIPK